MTGGRVSSRTALLAPEIRVAHSWNMPSNDQESTREPWLNDWDTNGLWENQVQPLTVGDLRAALESLAADLPVTVEHRDASGHGTNLRPMHVDATGDQRQATGVIITVA